MFKSRKILFSSTMVISMVLLSSCFSSNYSLKFTNGTFQSSEESIQDAIENEYLLKNIIISLEEIEPISECAEAKYDNSLFPDECKNIIRNFVDKKQYKCDFIIDVGKEYTCDITQRNRYHPQSQPPNHYFFLVDITSLFLDLNPDTEKTRATFDLILRFEHHYNENSDGNFNEEEVNGVNCYFISYTIYPLTGDEGFDEYKKYNLPIPVSQSHSLDFYPNNN